MLWKPTIGADLSGKLLTDDLAFMGGPSSVTAYLGHETPVLRETQNKPQTDTPLQLGLRAAMTSLATTWTTTMTPVQRATWEPLRRPGEDARHAFFRRNLVSQASGVPTTIVATAGDSDEPLFTDPSFLVSSIGSIWTISMFFALDPSWSDNIRAFLYLRCSRDWPLSQTRFHVPIRRVGVQRGNVPPPPSPRNFPNPWGPPVPVRVRLFYSCYATDGRVSRPRSVDVGPPT